jgi:hypothetical protein
MVERGRMGAWEQGRGYHGYFEIASPDQRLVMTKAKTFWILDLGFWIDLYWNMEFTHE